ncbi:MAG: SLC13 family permease [Verrucomicrobiales bacterium]|nr:SLC13 family permease [Verrucomicrobiales bacterium]MCP5525233.1 SLC13 family permease [Verrucomicrobiales bacterium]
MLDIALVLTILVLAMICFVTEKLPADFVAVMIIGALLVLGLAPPDVAVSGFSNPATVTVACMFVLSAGLDRTGAIRVLGQRLISLGRNRSILLVLIMVTVGTVSAFINNTAAVAVFLPVVLGVARARRVAVSRLLIPLSYASQFGGICTLIGTSTNILVSGIAEREGVGAFRMFEMAPVGMFLFVAGAVFLVTIGQWFLPNYAGPELLDTYQLRDYLSELVVKEGSPLVDKSATDFNLSDRHDVTVLEILRDNRKIWFPLYEPLKVGDILLVRGKINRLLELQSKAGLEPEAEFRLSRADLQGSNRRLVEALVAPGSELIGHTLTDLQFRRRYNTVVLGVQRQGHLLGDKLAEIRFELGDALLLLGKPEDLKRMQASGDVVMLGEVEGQPARGRQAWVALSIVAAVVGFAASGLLPIMTSAILGCIAMILSRCLDMGDAYESLDWRVLFLLAGVLPLGSALQDTGAAKYIADLGLKLVGPFGAVGVLAGVYVMTAMLTECMSNNASAAVMAPIAISIAAAQGIDPKPLLMAVTFAASSSFATPVGYQTNLMVYNAGGYRFRDFMRVGIPLNILFAALAIWLIPLFWPL